VLQQAGAHVTLCNRTRERAELLARTLPGADVLDWSQAEAALADNALLVNTTSLGMAGHAPLDLDLSRAAAGSAVADIVYTPMETPLLAQARVRGLLAVPGLGMLLHQAVPGFAAWFGVMPTVDAEVFEIVMQAA
jgi:shikimate dehydrogenase